MKIQGNTKFAGIIGYPVKHSLSPVFQNAAFSEAGLDWVYLPFEIKPEELRQAVLGLAAAGCRGLNVTIPFKQSVIELLDELDETAALLKAVNVIEFRGGRLIGHNTDGAGFIQSLRDIDFNPRGKSILLVGAGGAAYATAIALADAGALKLKIVNRTKGKADEIARIIQSRFSSCEVYTSDIDERFVTGGCDLVVNTTSVGMEGDLRCPIQLEGLKSSQIVYDIIYWPLETELLKVAKSRGACTVNGIGMLLYQGAAAFTIWTKKPAPLTAMAEALADELEKFGLDKNVTIEQSFRENIIRRANNNAGTIGQSKGGQER